MEINLILTLSYSIPDVLCCGGSGACPSPLVRQICNSFYYVSIFQIISYLTTSPTHTWKSTLYLPFPIPFQMYFVVAGPGACPSPLVRQICNSFYYVSIFQIISYLTTSPTHTWKSTLYLPFPIPFQMLFPAMVRSFYVPPLKSLRCENGWGP